MYCFSHLLQYGWALFVINWPVGLMIVPSVNTRGKDLVSLPQDWLNDLLQLSHNLDIQTHHISSVRKFVDRKTSVKVSQTSVSKDGAFSVRMISNPTFLVRMSWEMHGYYFHSGKVCLLYELSIHHTLNSNLTGVLDTYMWTYKCCGCLYWYARWHPHDYIAKPLKGWFSRLSTAEACRTGWLVLVVAGWEFSELAGCVAARKTAGTACCSSLRPARWGVLFSEARWSQQEDLADYHLSLHSQVACWL
jgi:hypothetical protein